MGSLKGRYEMKNKAFDKFAKSYPSEIMNKVVRCVVLFSAFLAINLSIIGIFDPSLCWIPIIIVGLPHALIMIVIFLHSPSKF